MEMIWGSVCKIPLPARDNLQTAKVDRPDLTNQQSDRSFV